jgi:NADPH2:quinone reductase
MPCTDGLDVVTAALAMELGHSPSGGTLFMQGASGAVGALVTQMAVANGVTVIGTASERTRAFAESLGARVVDYRDTDWLNQVRELTSGGADVSIDHTGNPLVRGVTARRGILVHTGWSGRTAAIVGGFMTNVRRYAHPRERLCAVPQLIELRPAKYRQLLQEQLNAIMDGRLRGPDVQRIPFSEFVRAHRELDSLAPGHKLVLEMPSP